MVWQIKEPGAYLYIELKVPPSHIRSNQFFNQFDRNQNVALISRAEDVVGIAVLNFRGEVTFPAGFAKGMLAGHLHWLFPIRNGEEADLTLHKNKHKLVCRFVWYSYRMSFWIGNLPKDIMKCILSKFKPIPSPSLLNNTLYIDFNWK